MKIKLLLSSLFVNFLLIIAACGGPVRSVSNISASLRAFVGAVPGFHGLTIRKTTAFNLSLVPELHAQATTTVSFTGSYSGFCSIVSEGSGAPIPSTGAITIYGSGSLDSSACNKTWFVDNPDNALTAAINAPGNQLVIGSGTLGPLVAWANSSTATVKVYVNRGKNLQFVLAKQ